jgi:superfamily II DNA helicase RecQ
MSPQMLFGPRMSKYLDQIPFKELIGWLLIDEVHLVDEEDSIFQKPYQNLSKMRARLTSKTVWAAVTGSATPEHAKMMAKALGFQPDKYVDARYSIDRPNVKYIPRFFRHPTSGYEFFDISFVIPFNIKSFMEIEPTIIFATTINTSYRLMQFLDSIIPNSIHNRLKIIKLYNSMMPSEYRTKLKADFQDDSNPLRIVVATDTCTYGLDLPNVRRVVTFDMCPTPENLKQKAGRPGRDGKPAVAITFAPAWVHNVPESEIEGKQAQDDLKRRLKLPEVMRQWYNPTPSLCTRGADLQYNGDTFVCVQIAARHIILNRRRAGILQWLSVGSSTSNPLPIMQIMSDSKQCAATGRTPNSLGP